jgi:hypothetical protein
LWTKEQTVQGRAVQLVQTKDRTLYVTFPDSSSNFYATVKNNEDLADVLLMVFTYAPMK